MDRATQVVYESVQFACDVFSQEIKNVQVSMSPSSNIPDLLHQTATWLESLKCRLLDARSHLTQLANLRCECRSKWRDCLRPLLECDWLLLASVTTHHVDDKMKAHVIHLIGQNAPMTKKVSE